MIYVIITQKVEIDNWSMFLNVEKTTSFKKIHKKEQMVGAKDLISPLNLFGGSFAFA